MGELGVGDGRVGLEEAGQLGVVVPGAVVVEARVLVERLAGVAVRDAKGVVVGAVALGAIGRIAIVLDDLARAVGWRARFDSEKGRASDLTGASVGLMMRGIVIERSLWYDESCGVRERRL